MRKPPTKLPEPGLVGRAWESGRPWRTGTTYRDFLAASFNNTAHQQNDVNENPEGKSRRQDRFLQEQRSGEIHQDASTAEEQTRFQRAGSFGVFRRSRE